MRTRIFSAPACFAVLVSLLATALLCAEPDPAPPGKENASRPKTVAFEMRDKPWSSVLEWLSDQTGLPVITSYKPTGTFSFIDPKKKEYTIPEIIDILNEGLLEKKFVLIRRERSFTIVPADEKIPPDYLPRIRVEDLEGHGNTEIAQIVLPLNSLVAEDLQPEVKKMMGPFGEAVAMAKANQLILTDTVGNLKRVCKTIKDIEETENQGKETFSYVCRYIKARDAEKNLRELLGDPKELLRSNQPMFPFGGFGGGRGGGGGGGFMQQPQPQPVAAAPAQKIRMHYISCDERTNTVLVTGPADKIAQAREILKSIDVPQQGQQPVIVGPAFLKTYPIAAGNAEALAKILQDTYKSSQIIRISAAGNNTILVWAPPEDQIEIAKHIMGATENNQITEVLPLNAQDATKTVERLKGMFGETKAGAPYLEADTDRNAVVVRGSTEQLAQIKAALQAIGETGVSSGTMRVITINKGSAAAVAEALQRMLPQMRQNPVKVIMPGSTETKPAAPADKPAAKSSDSPGGGEEQEPPSKGQLEDPQKKAPAAEKPGKKESPITITAVGNKLVVTSDDPQALALVQEMVRLLTTTPGAEGDFEVIKLKNASATEAAKVLDEAFNGTKQQPSQQGFPFFNPFRGMGAQVPATPTENRIRVVADPTSNSLLVKASPVDMLTIRRLLEKAIDSGANESNAIDRTWVVGPLKYASAADVANVVRDVYREHLNNNPTPGQTPGFRFRGPIQNLNLDANGNPRAVTLSVGVDDRSNSLIVNCSTAMHEDIKKLADTLDVAAKDSTKTIQVVPIRGVDPTLVQQAIYAIQGRTPPGQPGNNQNQNRGGFPGMGGGMGGNRGGFGGGNNGNGQRGNNGRGGGGPTASLSPGSGTERGPDFFADRVTDDPQQTALLYDPHHDLAVASGVSSDQGLAEEQEEQAPPRRAPAGQTPSGNIPGPRSDINVDAVPELGAVIISGNTPADVEEIIRVIRELEKISEPAQVEIQLVRLRQADATSVSNTLNQVFQRVTVGPYSSTANTRATTSTTVQNPFFQASSTTQPNASVLLMPLPRQNAILVAAPKVRMPDIIKEIDRLDVPDSKLSSAHSIPLKRASAARVATLLINFYAQRYPTEGGGQMQVRITHDDSTNSLIVQAAPADLAQIRELAMQLDSMESQAVNDLLIVPLHYIGSDELTAILQQAIYQGIVAPTAPTVGPSGTATPPTGGVGGGGFGGGGFGGGGFGGGVGGGARPPGTTGTTGFGTGITGAPGATTGIGAPGAAAPTVSPAAAAAGVATKTTTLRLIGPKTPGRLSTVAESGLLEDIHVTSVARINSVIISAPTKSMDLILKLIAQLDVLPQLRADIKIFPLRNADANATAILLQQLFLGTGGTTGTTTPTAPTGAPFGGFGGGGVPGGGFGGGGAGAAGAGAFRAPATTAAAPGSGFAQGATTETAPLILLRIAVDQRTNSVIVGGSRADLDMVEVIIDRLDNARIQNRPSRIYQMRNAAAADVASAINTFLNNRLTVLSAAQQLTAFQEIQQAVVVVPEPVSNKLLISATPAYFDEIIRLIEQLDAEPPQVVIQCLIAEVDLTNTEEFGIQLGLQSPILFERSVTPQTFALGSGSISYANAAGGLVPPGVTVNSSINPTAQPGFLFNNVSNPLGNNPLASPNTVGYQGLTNLGVGFSSPLTSGVGGFVFSASSDAVNVLIRALATQGRVDVLSRPQLTTMDNQASSVLVGQSVPYVTGTNITATGLVTNSINYRNVGVSLQVVPRVSPDGKVIMRVVPEVSSVAATPIGLGNNVTATAFNDQLVQTTVIAQDGETVVLGGVISKNDSKIENKIPWLGDLPIVGALWRYRQESKSKNELIIIMTPHIVRTRLDADRILAEEAHRMDWILGDVLKIQGPSGMEPILPPPAPPGAPGSAFPGAGAGCDSANGAVGVPGAPGVDGNLPAPSMLPAQTGPPPTPVSPPGSATIDSNIPMPFHGTPNPTDPPGQQASGFYPAPGRKN